MLSYEEVERCLLKIFCGKEMVLVEKDDRDFFVVFKYPTNNIRMRANIIYEDAYTRAIKDGILPVEDLEKLIEERNLFTDEDKKRVEKLENQIEGQRILLVKTTKVAARQDRLKGIIKKFTDELNELLYKKQSKLMLSAENKAEEVRSAFYCSACTYKEEPEELYWGTYKDFNNETSLLFKDHVLLAFMKFFSGIPATEMRFIARHNIWRIRYLTSQKTSEQLFGVPTAEYNNDMLSLAYWSNFYQNIFEMMPEHRPPDSIIEDDDALDAYMDEYYKERNREDAERRSRVTVKGKLSAFDKEEVIVTKSNELYEEIEYTKPREAQRLKDKDVSLIKKRTKRKR